MVIGLTGKAGCGKTTVADYLVSKYGFKKVNFKDALVEEMKENLPDVLRLLANNEDYSVDELFIKKPPLMRALMQNYGTEVRRGDNENYWIDKWIHTVSTTEGNIVVDDCRFLNESDAVKLQNGKIIRLQREGIEKEYNHQSELEMDSIEVDELIECQTGDLDCLYQHIDKIINNYEGKEKE